MARTDASGFTSYPLALPEGTIAADDGEPCLALWWGGWHQVILPIDPVNGTDLERELGPVWQLECQGRTEEAIAALHLSIERFPRAATLFEVRGALYAKLEFRRAAQRDFEIATWIDPDRPGAWSALGRIRESLGLSYAALEAVGRARQLGSNDTDLHLTAARAQRRLGRRGEAAVSYGRALVALGNPPALALLLEAATLLNDHPVSPELIGRACALVGTGPEAFQGMGALLGADRRPRVPALRRAPGTGAPEAVAIAQRLAECELGPESLARWTQIALVAVSLDDPRPGVLPGDAIAYAPGE